MGTVIARCILQPYTIANSYRTLYWVSAVPEVPKCFALPPRPFSPWC